jgi:predicted phage tail protein
MKRVILYGDLRKKFGKEFKLNVNTPAEAIKALRYLLKGFEKYFIEHNEPGFLVKVGTKYKDAKELQEPDSEEVIKIVPYIVGSKGAFKIILGIALIAFALSPLGAAGLAGGLISQSSLLSFGISTLLSGIAEVLFTPPKPPSPANREKDARPSYAFDGPVNTVEQGNPVPLCYGELLVGSQVISAVIIAKDI